MRILHIISRVDPESGGPIQGVILQERVTAEKGLVTSREIVSLDPPNAKYLEGFPIKVTALGKLRPGRDPVSRFLNHYCYSGTLVPWLEANYSRFDLIFVHGLWNYAPFGASRILPGLNIPYFVFPHGMMDPWFRKAYPLKHALKQIFWWFGEGRLASSARSMVFTCEEEKLMARGVFAGHKYRETVVPYGTIAPPRASEAQRCAFHARVPELGDRRYLLFLSRIHQKKGCDMLIEAFAQVTTAHPDVDLVIAGPDQIGWVRRLQDRALELGISGRIHWPGGLFNDAKWGALYGADAFILPSHQENFGIVVAEALACGTPVLISDKVNIWREIQADGSGIVATDTTEGTQALLEAWLSLTEIGRARMREASKRTFRVRFDVYKTVPELLNVLKEAL